MVTRIHYYGSVFELDHRTDDDGHRRIIQANLDHAAEHGPATFWFDLAEGGHVSLKFGPDTHFGVQTD